MKFKKSILTLGTISTIAIPVAAVVSCGTVEVNYDFGLATPSINSLNYIRNKNTAVVAPSLIDGIFKTMPSAKDLVNMLKLPKVKLNSVDPDGNQLTSFLNIDQVGFNAGVLHNSTNDFVAITGRALPNQTAWGGVTDLAMQLNGGESKWSNGEPVTANDFVDGVKYVLDLNTGSQYLTDLLDLNIKNAQEVVDAQNDYFIKWGISYIDPFGYKNGWESQIDGDDAEVMRIHKAAANLGYYTSESKDADGKNRKPVWANNAFGGEGSSHQVDPQYQLFMSFEDTSPSGWVDPLDFFTRSYMFPINRNFVESIGGIRKFGSDKESFLWNGPFNPKEMVLGPQGYITLTKRDDYYSSDKTLSDKIKIYFQDNPVITSSMYDDGYISKTNIPAAYMMKFWSDEEVRSTMQKSGGFGTIGFQLNLDHEKGTNKALQDQDFREALEYALDRNDMLKMTGWDSSFPVTTWTAFGQGKDNYGQPIETFFDKETYKPYEGADTMPIQSYTWLDHKSKDYKFEHVDRTDIAHLPDVANHFMDAYKAKDGSPSKVTLKYIYDGTPAGKNAGITLQSELKKVFGGYVDVEIKGLPSNVFEDYRTSGDFDILYMNFDSYGSSKESYVKRFVTTDEINTKLQKTTGFKLNPSGSWTYGKYLTDNNGVNADLTRAKALFNPDGSKTDTYFESLWNKFESLVTPKTGETPGELTKRTDGFFNGLDSDPKWTGNKEIIDMISLMEKVIKDGAPVLPLMEVDTKWIASRVVGAGALYTFSLQFAYDVDRKPIATLPGREALAQ